MAGLGERFKKGGYETPKPFIKLGGKCLSDLSIECYPKKSDFNKHYYIFRSEHKKYFSRKHKEYYLMKENTKGPLETIIRQEKVLEEIATDESVLIADCDSMIKRGELLFILKFFKDNKADGGVPVRIASNKGYSYAKVSGNTVLETREKDPFTNWSTTGPYWFKSGLDFIDAAIRTMKKGIYSLSPVYNDYIKNDKKVLCYPTETFIHLGTPKELEDYAKYHGIALQQ